MANLSTSVFARSLTGNELARRPIPQEEASSVTLSRRGVRFGTFLELTWETDEPNEAFYFFGQRVEKTRDCSDTMRYACPQNFLGSGLEAPYPTL